MVGFGACAKAEEADLDFGFWIVVVSVLYVEGLNAVVWILDFGFRQRFGFCIIRLLLLHAVSGRRIWK